MEKIQSLEKTFRLFDFNVYNEKVEVDLDTNEEDGPMINHDPNQFMIQMFGMNEKGKTCSIIVEGFKPFFYVKVEDSWNLFQRKRHQKRANALCTHVGFTQQRARRPRIDRCAPASLRLFGASLCASLVAGIARAEQVVREGEERRRVVVLVPCAPRRAAVTARAAR